LIITLGQPGDRTDDASVPWPDGREQVDVGTLTLDSVESEETSPARDINFDPLVLPAGIAPSDDPLLSARSAEDLVAPAFEAQAEPGLGFAATVFPGIVVKGDAPVEGAVNDIDSSLLGLSDPKMVAAQTECGDLDACFTEVSKRDGHMSPSQRKDSIAAKAESDPEPGVAV